MQINRMFEIVYILLNRKTVTAGELAEHFEVSVRTIYRDVEALCQAGIPVYMSKGKGGGIKLLDNFVLNKSILSDSEQREILTALQGLNAIRYPGVEDAISKLGAFFNKNEYNWIDADFSHWGSGDNEKFMLIKTAIINKRVITFEYYNSYGTKSSRRVEPLQLWFKDKSWYLRAYCLSKNAFRVFKFTRLREVRVTEDSFERELQKEWFEGGSDGNSYRAVDLKLHLNPNMAYRVYDEFNESDIVKNEDGSFTVKVSYPESEWVYGYILSFGGDAEVIEPKQVRDIVKERLIEALKKYT